MPKGSGRKPGSPKTGGRKPGVPNKRNSQVREMLAAMGCDPIRGMARIAMSKRKNVSVELKARMFAELARYCYPQLKAVEHSGTGPDGSMLGTLADIDSIVAAGCAGDDGS